MNETSQQLFFNGAVFAGEWRNGWKYRGKYTLGKDTQWAGNSYEGEWTNDRMHGEGIYKFSNGNVYSGQWKDDRMHGTGTLKYANGDARLMSYESLAEGGFATGTMLGSGGFIAFDEDQCIVRNTWNFARFYSHESCGQCSPCREGTSWMEKVLNRIENGNGREEDIDLLWSIQSKIEGNTICPLGDAAAWPVASAIRHFRDEFEYHVRFPEKIKNREHFVEEPFESVQHLLAGSQKRGTLS